CVGGARTMDWPRTIARRDEGIPKSRERAGIDSIAPIRPRRRPQATMKSTGLNIFDGAVAIVTGAASGIGQALSEELARRGASVALADLQSEVVDVAARIPCTSGPSARGITVDVSDFESVRRLIESVAAQHGRLDYLFNNAGIAAGGEVRDH